MKKRDKKQENTPPPAADPVEEHVREIMEIDPKPEVSSSAKKAESSDKKPSEDSLATAPELPGKSIKVNFHEEESAKEGTKTPDSIQSEIEKINKQLQTDTPVEIEEEKLPPDTVPEAGVATAPAVSNAVDSADKKPAEETESTVDEPETEAAEAKTDDKQEAATEEADSVTDSPDTDKAIEEIIAQESDQILAVEDEKLSAALTGQQTKSDSRFKEFLASLGHSKAMRRLTAFLLIASLAAAFAFPASRYTVLNTAGVRSSTSMTVIDQSTQQPLKNVTVRVGEQSAQTNDDGVATLQQLKLGPTEVTIERRAFAVQKRQITIGWGSNPLGEYALQPVGTQYVFKVTDYVSGQPAVKAEATYEDASAYSDEEGVIKLTVDDINEDTFEVSITKDGYRTEQVGVNIEGNTDTAIEMVSDRKHAFISKRSGKHDVYKIDADGKNEELVLEGTGNEREDMVLVTHPTEEMIALVSTRDGERNKDGFLLSTLNIINLSENSVYEVTKSERVQVIGWADNYLTYVQITSGASASHPGRHRLVSYNYESDEKEGLASANYFNDVTTIDNRVYYAPSSAYMPDRSSSLYAIDADGSDKKMILDKEAWSLLRTSYDNITIALQQEWYRYQPGSDEPEELEGEPASMTSRVYTDSPDGSVSLWVDRRDGKGVLLAYDTEAKEDRVLHAQSGLKNPVRWLDDRTLVFRVQSDTETADYVMSLDGGEPKKISDVTDTNGIDRWYYY